MHELCSNFHIAYMLKKLHGLAGYMKTPLHSGLGRSPQPQHCSFAYLIDQPALQTCPVLSKSYRGASANTHFTSTSTCQAEHYAACVLAYCMILHAMVTVQERPGLVVLTIELEGALAQMPGSLSPSRMWSPYRQPLAKFLNKYSADVSQSAFGSWCTQALDAILVCNHDYGDVAPAVLCSQYSHAVFQTCDSSSCAEACSKHLSHAEVLSTWPVKKTKVLSVNIMHRRMWNLCETGHQLFSGANQAAEHQLLLALS